VITPVSTRLPVGPRGIAVLSHSGFMLPVPDPEGAAAAVREFLTTPIEWYMHLAIATSEHGRVSLSKIRVPAAFVAAKWDVLAGSRDMASAAARIPEATYVELVGSHFIQMEQPDKVHELLLEFLGRVG
jgi:pimeloyl-ACP methyl ester carboxylesterase